MANANEGGKSGAGIPALSGLLTLGSVVAELQDKLDEVVYQLQDSRDDC